MYLNRMRFENVGPIDFLAMDISSDDGNAPKRLVFVGKNGSGKSIILSQIVSSMLNAHNVAFEDSDVERGKIYKVRNPAYIRRGQLYSLAHLDYSSGFFAHEIVLKITKEDFEGQYNFTPMHKHWNRLDAKSNSESFSNFFKRIPEIRAELTGPHLYFPPNRFEEPAWLNEADLKNRVEYFEAKLLEGHSNRQVVQYSPMKLNQSWLLDLIYDALAIERKFVPLPDNLIPENPIGFIRQTGPANTILTQIESFLLKILGGEKPINWGVGGRSNRSISLTAAGEVIVSNLLSLSTGEAVLLDLFLTILRHADLSGQSVNSLEEIRGLVVIDEVDLHLHTDLQHEMLPELISALPGVQFIMSSHSPLFLLGMEKTFGEGGFTIVELPSGERISVERFAEFERAYEYFSSTRRFERDIRGKIFETIRPLLIVEGAIDMDYIRKAAEHLGELDLLNKFEFVDGDGFKGLDKIWKNLHTERWKNINQTVVLLYDCDVKGKNNEIGKAYQRTIPYHDTIITNGIENLFPDEVIHRAKGHKEAFIDYIAATSGVKRGERYETPESWAVNPDEKRNLCNWICENGTAADFDRFKIIFDILRDCIA